MPLKVKYWTGNEIKSGACALALSLFTFTVRVEPLQHFMREEDDGSGADNVDTLSLIRDPVLC